MEEETREEVRPAPNPTGKGGFGDNPQNINVGGRPKNSMKSYVARKLAQMTDEEKDVWLKEHKIAGIDQWKMGEGNPVNENDITPDGTLSQLLVQFMDGKPTDNNTDTQ